MTILYAADSAGDYYRGSFSRVRSARTNSLNASIAASHDTAETCSLFTVLSFPFAIERRVSIVGRGREIKGERDARAHTRRTHRAFTVTCETGSRSDFLPIHRESL